MWGSNLNRDIRTVAKFGYELKELLDVYIFELLA